MIDYVRTTPNHLVYIHEQASQEGEAAIMLSPAFIGGFGLSVALTGFEGFTCLGCAGLIDFDKYAIVWAYLDRKAGKHFTPITRKVNRVLARYAHKKLVTYVRPDFAQGRRWMTLLGFERVEENVSVAGSLMDVYERRART